MSEPDASDHPEGPDEGERGPDRTSVPLADTEMEMAELRSVAQAILALPEGEELPVEVMQRAITALAKTYAVRFQAGERVAPFRAPRAMPPTVAMIFASQTLKSTKLEVFELSMWQMWSGG